MNYWHDQNTHEYITYDRYGYCYIVEYAVLGVGHGSFEVDTFEEVQFIIWLINYVRQGREKGLL